MVSKKTLQMYNIEELQQFFNLIIQSEINGQNSQCKRQFDMLSKKQKLEFCEWLKSEHTDRMVIEWQSYLLEQLIN